MKHLKKQNLKQLWQGWVLPLVVAIVVATSFKSAIADWNIVPTGSMNPTIVQGDRIFVNKLAYDLKIPYTTQHLAHWQDPQRGDIVVFFSPTDGQRMVKRIVGLPGDTIAMNNNRLVINGRPLAYDTPIPPALRSESHQLEENLDGRPHPIIVDPNLLAMHSFASLKIPEDHYFAMGDNRDNSKDSRYFGFVERSRIVGRATAVVISLEENSILQPRWKRFFSPLR